MTKYRVTATDGLNVRTVPTPMNNVPIGVLPLGAVVDVIGSTANGWHQLGPIVVSGVTLAKGQAYAISDWLVPVADPPPTAKQTYPAWGANYPNGNLHLVEPAWQGGARAFLIIDDFLFATQLSQRPGAFVVARRGDPSPYLTGRLTEDVNRMVQWLEGAGGGPTLKYVGLNEGDNVGMDLAAIPYRAQFDVAMAHRVRAISGATWVAGSFSMGTPHYPDPAICAAMKAGYAEAYNAGLLMFDYHNYERNPEDISKSLDYRKWYSQRHQFLFGRGPDRCGFDPRVKGIVHCESGVDGGGGGRQPGGFTQYGMTGPQVVEWHAMGYHHAGTPILVDGVLYDSPVVAGMYFQVGSNQWAGFEMRQYLADMAGHWTPGRP